MITEGTLVAVALLSCAVGVLGSVVPGIPGTLGSLGGVGLYRFATGDPGVGVFVLLVSACLVAFAADVLAGPLAARIGGASQRTSLLAGGVGFVLFFVAGPLGVVIGITGTVFLLEIRRHGDSRRARRAAVATTIGALSSIAVQVITTLSVLLVVASLALG